MTGPIIQKPDPLSFLYKDQTVPQPQPQADPLGFLYNTPKQQATTSNQGFVDFLSNVGTNWIKEGAGKSILNVARLMDPLNASRMMQDPAIGMAATDLGHVFDNIFTNPISLAKTVGSSIVSSVKGATGSGLAIGMVKPVTDLMELSSGLNLSGDETHPLAPEERAARIKSSVALMAASAIAGPLAGTLGVPGGIAARVVNNAVVGAAGGAVYGAVAGANEKDQIAQIISGGVMGGTLGLAHGLLFGDKANPRPEDIAQTRQLQIENNSPASVVKLAQALATNDDIAAAIIEGKVGLEEGDVHIVPGVNPSRLAFLDKKLPEGYRSVIHIDKDGVGHLMVYDESLPIDERFYGRNGMIENQVVSYNGKDSYAVKNVVKDVVSLQDLNNPNTIIDVPKDDVRMLSNVQVIDPTAGAITDKLLYHGTNAVFDKPDPAKFDAQGLYGPGYYMTEDQVTASGYVNETSEASFKPSTTGNMIRDRFKAMLNDGFNDPFNIADSINNIADAVDKGDRSHWQIGNITGSFYVNGKIMSFEDLMDHTPLKPGNVRIQKTNATKFFNIDKQYTEAEANAIVADVQAKAPAGRYDGMMLDIGKLVDNTFKVFKRKAISGNILYSMLAAKSDLIGTNGKEILNGYLKDAGYDGITHVGGFITNNPTKHQVYILFDPDKAIPPSTTKTIKVGIDTREAVMNNVYAQWKDQLEKSVPSTIKPPTEPGIIDNSVPQNLLDRIPDLHQIDVQRNLNKWLASKGFQGDDLTSLRRELQSRLAKEANAAYLEPDEQALIQEAQKAKPEKQKLLEFKELNRVAKSNGFAVSDGGSGRVIVRDLQSDKILRGFSNSVEAAKWMNKTNQAFGPKLDDNSTIDTSIAAGGMPPLPPEDNVAYASDQPYNYMNNKANKGESMIRFLDNFGIITRNQDFMKHIDTEYGTNFFNRVFDNLAQKSKIRSARMLPYAEEFASLLKKSKLSTGERETVFNHMQSISPEEAASSLMYRPMNPFELKMGAQLAKSGVDIEHIFKYRREVVKLDKEFPLDERQTDPAKEAEYQGEITKAQQAYAIDNEHLDYVKTFDQIAGMSKDDASLGGIVEYARTIINNGLTQSEFAAKNKMSFDQILFSNRLADLYKRLAPVFGINPKNMLNRYINHAKLYYDGDVSRALDSFSGDIKTKDFYSNLSRTGEISAFEQDPAKAFQRYLKGGFDVQSGFAQAVADARNGAKEELLKIPDAGAAKSVDQVVTRYIDDMQGFPGAKDRAAQEAVQNLFTKMHINADVNVRGWVNAANNLVAAAGLGARPFLGLGHLGLSSMISTAARSLNYTRRVITAGGKAISDGSYMQDLQERGVMAGLSPLATISSVESAGTPKGVYNKVTNALFKATLLPTVYDAMAAGHYTVASQDALSALTDFKRGAISWKDVEKKTFLNMFDAPVIDKFKELSAGSNPSAAADYLGRQAIEDLVGTYGNGNHPSGWGSNLGRIAGQFGNFAMFVRAAVERGMSRGSVMQRVTYLPKLAAMSYAVGKIGDELGIDLNRMSPFHAMTWLFGPLEHVAEDAVTAIKGTGYAQESAKRRLLKMIPVDKDGNFQPSLLLPGSFAIDGMIKAADDFSQGNTGTGVAEALGFRKAQQQQQ